MNRRVVTPYDTTPVALEPAGGPDIVEVAQMVFDADEVEHPASPRRATPMPSGPLKPPNWPPP